MLCYIAVFHIFQQPGTWALLLHDGFQPLRPVGKVLDGELLLIRDARSRNVVKQTPSSLRARAFPLARWSAESRIPQNHPGPRI